MHKFIPLNKHRNSHIYVTNYDWPIEEYLKGQAILVRVNNLEDIVNIPQRLEETTKIAGYLYEDKYASLETIDINPKWGSTPIVMYINRLGKFRDVFPKISLLHSLNVTIIFIGKEEQSCIDAQILSSLGISTGIKISPDSELSDSVLDLIAYNFYSMCPHSQIEPFDTICRYYDGESYVSPEMANFINPLRYIYVNKDRQIAFSEEELNKPEGKKFPLSIVGTDEFYEELQKEYNKWEDFFIQSHPCTFCPAFRICTSFFNKDGKKRCKEVMSELLEAIEYHKKSQQKHNLERCQP